MNAPFTKITVLIKNTLSQRHLVVDQGVEYLVDLGVEYPVDLGADLVVDQGAHLGVEYPVDQGVDQVQGHTLVTLTCTL